MTNQLEVYKCNICGNMVEILHTGASALVCCGQPMELLNENTTDAATEKHVPVIEKKDNGYQVTVGSVEHPSTDEHYIEWIELIVDGNSYTVFLKPGDKPTAFFAVEGSSVTAREHCNLHGLWKAEA